MKVCLKQAKTEHLLPVVTFALIGSTAGMLSSAWGQTPYHIDTAAAGQAVHRDILGQNVPTIGGETVYNNETLDLTPNSSIRGVAGGLSADSYNWKSRTGYAAGDVGAPGPPTLEYLRNARDNNANLFITVNTRGTGNNYSSSDFVYTDTTAAPLNTLAADWVRYTNIIAPTYKQGDSLSAGDTALVNSLNWGLYDKLRSAGEAPTNKVKYWEIGNEPEIGIVDADDPSGSTGFSLTPAQYADRYVAITQAMRAVDPTIKVGPVLTRGVNDDGTPNSYLLEVLKRSNAQVDFISYHPYTVLFNESNGGGTTTIPEIEERLRYIRPKQQSEYQLIRNAIQKNNDDSFFGLFGPIRDLDTPVVASEWNPGSWPVGGLTLGRTMGQALGAAETVFNFAQNQNMIAAQYWVWPTSWFQGAHIPVYKAFEGLRDHMGDTLVDVLADDSRNIRLYTTRNSSSGEIVLWGLNFSDDTSQTLQLSLDNLLAGQNYNITLMRLTSISGGDVSLLTYTSNQLNVPQSIDWLTSDLTGSLDLHDFNLTLDDATITALILTPVPEPSLLTILSLAGGSVAIRRCRRNRR